MILPFTTPKKYLWYQLSSSMMDVKKKIRQWERGKKALAMSEHCSLITEITNLPTKVASFSGKSDDIGAVLET